MVENLEEVEAAIKSDLQKVAKAFKRRLQMFFPTNMPIMDIMKAFKEALIQMGLNLARDLILNGILWTIQEVRDMCDSGEAEKENAPYSPVGQIDLSSFILQSDKTADGPPVDMKESQGYITIAAKSQLSLEDYEKLLNEISAEYTINELCSLLDDTAIPHLYNRLLTFLQNLDFLSGSNFYELYVNEDGLRNFLEILSADIEDKLCVAAKNLFEQQKKMILNICVSSNDELAQSELADFMTPEELMQAMADAHAHKLGLAKDLFDTLNSVMAGPIEMNQFCSIGKGSENDEEGMVPYPVPQRQANEKAANAIFGGIEKMANMELDRVKEIYKDAFNIMQLVKPDGAAEPAFAPEQAKGALMHALDIESDDRPSQDAILKNFARFLKKNR